MTNEPPSNPAFAFAIYASTAATAAIVALRDANLIDGDEIKKLAENLTICRLEHLADFVNRGIPIGLGL